MQKSQLIYIGGAGRSGSTLLDMILGNIPGFISLGEVRYFWEYVDYGHVLCGCGEELTHCPFWSKVLAILTTEYDIDIARMAVLSKRLHHTRNLLRIILNARADREWHELAEGIQLLYTTIAEVAERNVLVDASKVPLQLYFIRHHRQVQTHILHLVRDGRAVAYSWSRRRKVEPAVRDKITYMPRRSALHSIITWYAENQAILYFSSGLPYTLIRYEDFVVHPRSILSASLRKLGFADVDLSLLTHKTLSLKPTHSVGGNPIRFSRGPISIQPDDRWQHEFSSLTKWVLKLFAWPLMREFHYR